MEGEREGRRVNFCDTFLTSSSVSGISGPSPSCVSAPVAIPLSVDPAGSPKKVEEAVGFTTKKLFEGPAVAAFHT
jgi:hypothetical protein